MQIIHYFLSGWLAVACSEDVDPDLNKSKKSLIRPIYLIGIAIAIAASMFGSFGLAQAQDEAEVAIVGYRILGESTAGPHTVQLQVSPVTALVGTTRFAVRVRETATGADIGDAKVSLLGSPAEKGERQYTLALNSPVDRVFYLSQLELESPGVWAIDVEVESELGAGTTIMSVLVTSRGRDGANTIWGSVLFVLVSLSFAVGVGWLWYSSRKALRRRDDQR